MDSAIAADYALGFVATILATILVVADTVGDMRHNPGIGEGIGPIGFGIGQSLGVGVVLVTSFHAAVSNSFMRQRVAGPVHS